MSRGWYQVSRGWYVGSGFGRTVVALGFLMCASPMAHAQQRPDHCPEFANCAAAS
jgi:hypothetical protein